MIAGVLVLFTVARAIWKAWSDRQKVTGTITDKYVERYGQRLEEWNQTEEATTQPTSWWFVISGRKFRAGAYYELFHIGDEVTFKPVDDFAFDIKRGYSQRAKSVQEFRADRAIWDSLVSSKRAVHFSERWNARAARLDGIPNINVFVEEYSDLVFVNDELFGDIGVGEHNECGTPIVSVGSPPHRHDVCLRCNLWLEREHDVSECESCPTRPLPEPSWLHKATSVDSRLKNST